MKVFITAVLLISCTYLFGQTIEKYYTYNWKECNADEARFYSTIQNTDSGYVRKDYFLHERSMQMMGKYKDKECKVKDGYFHYYHPNKMLDAIGKYENNEKEGLWLHSYPHGSLMDSGVYSKGNITGTYLSWHSNGFMRDSFVIEDEGKGVQITWFDNGNISSAGFLVNYSNYGTWKYYHKNGQVSSKETYQNKVVVDKQYFNESGEIIIDTTNKDRDAVFPGGNKAWVKYLLKQIYFPSQFKIVNADQAVVVVNFTINEDGKLEDVEVSTPFYPDFDKIAKNAIMKCPGWLPAINHNRKVKSMMRQPITFAQ